jgi:Na+-transporting NADH:ubiquinone oxidoreductase subunit E
MQALVVLFAAVFTNNIAFTNFLGMCPFIAVSRDVKTAFGMGLAVTLVMTLTVAANWAIQHYLLEPYGVEHLQFIIFIVVIAAITQVLELAIERFSPDLYASFGVFLALIAVNCAILGVSLFMVLRGYGFLETVGYGIGSGLGWMLAIVALAGIREKIEKSDIPAGLKGPGITMISAGIMAMAFIGLTGLIV